jgi:hypothetical protein
VMGSCEHGNESSGFIKDEEFLDELSILYWLLKKNCSTELVKTRFL